jgi:hypothetical protein
MDVSDVRSALAFQIQQNKVQQGAGSTWPRDNPSVVSETPPSAVPETAETPVTAQEREFFVQMFPQSEPQIRSYPFYQRNGVRENVRLGTVIDRKV